MSLQTRMPNYFTNAGTLFRQPLPEKSIYQWAEYYRTVKKWIDSCTTMEQLDKCLPFIQKLYYAHRMLGLEISYKSIMTLFELWATKGEIILREEALELIKQ